MSVPPIVLWNALARRKICSDEGGVDIVKHVLPPPNIPGPYQSAVHPQVWSYVPPLIYLCIRRLLEYPDQIHVLNNIRLCYKKSLSAQSFDILSALIPNFDHDSTFDTTQLDPRLWAILIQLYSDLPQSLRSYHIPLSDKHVPLLQHIPCTPHFALITVLELPRCRELTDETVVELKRLHGLSAFDASGTYLTGYGIKVLAGALQWREGDEGEPEKMGPWGLRILYLKGCISVDNTVFEHLAAFVLLSVVDLRGTRCTSWCIPKGFSSSPDLSFYSPTPISVALDALASTRPLLPINHFTLHINSLTHRIAKGHTCPTVGMQDSFVVLPGVTKDGQRKAKIKVGNTHVLERRRLQLGNVVRHEMNKNAWYERHWDKLQSDDAGHDERYDVFGWGHQLEDNDMKEMGNEESEEDVPSEDMMDEDSLSDGQEAEGNDELEDEDLSENEQQVPHEVIDNKDSDNQLDWDIAEAVTDFFMPHTAGIAPAESPTGSSVSLQNESRRKYPPNKTASRLLLILQNARSPEHPALQVASRRSKHRSLCAEDTPHRHDLASESSSNSMRQQTAVTRPREHVPPVVKGVTSSRSTPSPVSRQMPARDGFSLDAPAKSNEHLRQRSSCVGVAPSESWRISTLRSTSQRMPSRNDLPSASDPRTQRIDTHDSENEVVLREFLSPRTLLLPPESPSTLCRQSQPPVTPLPPQHATPPTLTPDRVARDVTLNMQNMIAEAEGLDHASQQAATSFYGSGTHGSGTPRRFRQEAMCATRTGCPIPREEAQLMLFRDPPPWSVLGSIIRSIKDEGRNGRRRGSEDIAILNRDSTKAKAGIDGIMEMVKKRKVVSMSVPKSGTMADESTLTPKSRNPFVRKQATDGSSNNNSQSVKMSTSTHTRDMDQPSTSSKAMPTASVMAKPKTGYPHQSPAPKVRPLDVLFSRQSKKSPSTEKPQAAVKTQNVNRKVRGFDWNVWATRSK